MIGIQDKNLPIESYFIVASAYIWIKGHEGSSASKAQCVHLLQFKENKVGSFLAENKAATAYNVTDIHLHPKFNKTDS